MLQINQLLDRFKNLKNTEKEKKEAIVTIFEKNNLPIKIHQISILKNSIFIKVSPIIKTEIILKKDALIAEIKSNIYIKNISNIQ